MNFARADVDNNSFDIANMISGIKEASNDLFGVWDFWWSISLTRCSLSLTPTFVFRTANVGDFAKRIILMGRINETTLGY